MTIEDDDQVEDGGVTLRSIAARDIGSVKELWIELAEHHWRCAPEITALAEPLSAEDSWKRRRKQYGQWATEPGWLLIGAELEGRLVGYAAARMIPAASSWNFGPTVGKLETLVVQSDIRGHGIGTRLFDRVQHHWRAAGIGHGTVSIIAGNSSASRFYGRFGAVEYTYTHYFPIDR